MKIAFLTTQKDDLPKFIPEKYKKDLVLIHETKLQEFDPKSLGTLLVGANLDQILFAKQKSWIENFLATNGTLVFNGHIAYPFLPELKKFRALPKRTREELTISPIQEHKIFAGVDFLDLSCRRGVYGFYGRGENPPPKGAIAINRIGTGDFVVDWLWELPTGGRIFMHSGNSMWMYHGGDSSAAKVAEQLIDWCVEVQGE